MRTSLALAVAWALLVPQGGLAGDAKDGATALVIGDTFTIESKTLRETRRINVYLPPGYRESPGTRVPVLYMPDGGMAEDFLHVAGLVQVSVGNGTMRPYLLVGIENTQRRRDMTGPTDNEDERKIAPKVGGSLAFRTFVRDELMPVIRTRRPVKPRSWGNPSRVCSWWRHFFWSLNYSIRISPSIPQSGGTTRSW